MSNFPIPLPARSTAQWLPLVILITSFACGARGQIFTDWTSIDGTNSIVSGTLGSTTVTFTSTTAGNIYTTWLNGTYTGFAIAAFTPALGTSDALEFIGNPSSPNYTITFGVPVLNPILQFASAGSTLTVSGATPNFVSGDSRLSVNGNQVIGADFNGNPSPNNDANGTIQFPGTFSSLTFTAFWSGGTDGIDLQIGATAIPEPAVEAALLGVAAFGLVLARRRHRTI